MPVIISMLRGVNVGGHNLIKMDALRALYESLGLQDPQTYVQSGNVIFRTKERDPSRLARQIENEIRSEEHTSELQSQSNLVCRLLLEKKKKKQYKSRD